MGIHTRARQTIASLLVFKYFHSHPSQRCHHSSLFCLYAAICCCYFICFTFSFFFVLQDIDYQSFRCFLDAFLDCETPDDLGKHLFVSFLKPNVAQPQLHGKALNQMAAISSTAACAPVTAHTKGK